MQKKDKKVGKGAKDPCLVICAGLPGSGKSLLASKMGIPVFARDELGSTDAVKKVR